MGEYDVIVIGLGAMGGAAAYHCARRGARVLGLDAHPPGHALGSSHGATRAIRESYFEAPEYVPLAQRSFDLWRALEKASGKALLSVNGAVYVGPAGHKLIEGVVSASRQHDLKYERLTAAAAMKRFPGFALPEGWEAVFEPRGGVLRSEDCQTAHLALARAAGAELRFGEAMQGFDDDGRHFTVRTAKESYRAAQLILTVGPWACEMTADLKLPLAGRRITVVHFEAKKSELYPAGSMSVYFWATPEGIFAGFPHLEGEGVKIMRHDKGEVCTPSTIRREVGSGDVDEVARFADKYMPWANGGVRASHVCLYTMTPDNHFVIDRHPLHPRLHYACGFSGHGFKFAPVIGEVLADMALEGGTAQRVGFLSASRFNSRTVSAA